MAEKSVSLDTVLNQVNEREGECDWLGAANLYRTALSSLLEADVAKKDQLGESLAYALFKTAFQANRLEEFRNRLKDAVTAYRQALEAYLRRDMPDSLPPAKRCEAMLAFANYWLTSDQKKRKKLIAETWGLAEEALEGFEEVDNHEELGVTFHQLALSAALAYSYEEDYQRRESIVKSAVDHGERSIKSLEPTENTRLLAAVYAISEAFVKEFGDTFHDIHSRGPFDKRAADYWMKAVSLSEQQAILELPHLDLLGGLPSSVGLDETISLLQKALDNCRKTRDKLLIGCVLEWLAGRISWKGCGVEDEDTLQDLFDKSLGYAREAKEAFSSISHVTPRCRSDTWVEVPEAGHYARLVFFEKDLRKKRDLAEKGMAFVREQLRRAFDSGFPGMVWIAYDMLDHVLMGLADTETDPERKASLLEEAIGQRTKSLRLGEKLFPFDDFVRGWWHGPLGHAKLELAELAKDPILKEELLKEGIRCEETAVELTEKSLSPADELDATTVEIIGYCRHKSIDGLRSLYDLTGQTKHLEEAIEALEAAAESYRKVNMFSRVAECHWKGALFLDILDAHPKAAEKFRLASDDFKIAAESLPRLRALYNDYSQYMLAWEGIEGARYRHSRQEYAEAKESYERAAALHESTKKWSFLSANYLAWAQVENAEDMSQNERSKESIDSFREASKLFRDSETQMRERLAKIESPDEKQMVERLIEAVDHRQGLCRARIALEEARVLDKEGDLGSASEKYGLAADMFARIKQELPGEQDRKEIELIIILSRAWKAMAKAEAASSPELYEEAANLFDKAKNLGPGDKAKSLVMGHSRLCMALAAGARFADNGDAALHSAAVQSLESAAKYYLKANLESASEYAKGCKLLFDGYIFMNRASSEEDQQRKTRLYSMAEKVLQASASSFEKAGQPGRKEQVVKLLAKVKEDRELAVSLVEVFLAPDIVSTTMAFSSPAATHETAVGLDRFEHADVQATLVANPKELHVGQELNLEIELVNAGRGAAQLTRLEEAVPQGFDLVTAPDRCRIEDSHLNMRGRRLDALKTEDVKLVLKPTAKGRFVIKPRIMYLDESGKYKSSEPQPVTVTVKELGISGWLKGT